MTNHEKNQESRSFTLRSTSILLIVGSLIAVGVAARKNTLRPIVEKTTANDSLVQPTACRLVLAPQPIDKPIDQEIANQQNLIAKRSTSDAGFERLGWIFIKKARQSFDAGFYKLAEQCAACMEARGAKPADLLLLRAHALQSLHRFTAAEVAARELVKLRERPFDYGVLGDILIDQGKVREGAVAYQKMVNLRPDLQSYARAAHVRWITGDLEGAIELMKLATAASSPNDPEAAAWAFTRLALYQLQHGNTKQALQSSDAALSMQDDYAPAMLIRGRTLLAVGRTTDALVELQRAAKLNPLPEYQWTLADALTFAGHRDQATKIELEIAEHSTEDPRTVALFLATHHLDLERAVLLAQQELTNRGDVFTHDALAWALASAGRANEAKLHINLALSEGTADARLYLHAGVIAALNNDNKQAEQWLKQSDAIRQTLFPSERLQLDSWLQRIRAATAKQNSPRTTKQSIKH